jgi:hypothetical protein
MQDLLEKLKLVAKGETQTQKNIANYQPKNEIAKNVYNAVVGSPEERANPDFKELSMNAAMGSTGELGATGKGLSVAGEYLKTLPQKFGSMMAGKEIKLPINSLKSYEGVDNLRVQYYIDQIKSGKKVDPIKIIREQDGTIGVEDGKHRLEAFKRLGFEEIPTQELKKIPGEADKYTMMEYINRYNLGYKIPETLQTEADAIMQKYGIYGGDQGMAKAFQDTLYDTADMVKQYLRKDGKYAGSKMTRKILP